MPLTSEMLAAIAQQHGLLKKETEQAKPAVESFVGKFFMAAEVLAAAGLAGYVNGRFASEDKDHLSIFGLPADVVAGTVLFGGSLFGAFGEFDTHMAAVAAGFGSAATYREMFARGAAARVEQEEGKRLLRPDSAKGLGEGSSSPTEKVGADVVPITSQKAR